jgi:hypothetical protein
MSVFSAIEDAPSQGHADVGRLSHRRVAGPHGRSLIAAAKLAHCGQKVYPGFTRELGTEVECDIH